MSGRWILRAGASLSMLMLLAGFATPAFAQGSFGLAAGIYQPEDDDLDNTEYFALRGGYRLGDHFGIEGSLAHVDLGDTLRDDGPSIPEIQFDFQVDLYTLDLSLQWYPSNNGFVVFGGPGAARIDAEVEATIFGQHASESDSTTILTAHAGVAYEWRVGDRFFVRPEVRVRRYFDDEAEISDDDTSLAVSYEATDYEAGVTFGWKFGG